MDDGTESYSFTEAHSHAQSHTRRLSSAAISFVRTNRSNGQIGDEMRRRGRRRRRRFELDWLCSSAAPAAASAPVDWLLVAPFASASCTSEISAAQNELTDTRRKPAGTEYYSGLLTQHTHTPFGDRNVGVVGVVRTWRLAAVTTLHLCSRTYPTHKCIRQERRRAQKYSICAALFSPAGS